MPVSNAGSCRSGVEVGELRAGQQPLVADELAPRATGCMPSARLRRGGGAGRAGGGTATARRRSASPSTLKMSVLDRAGLGVPRPWSGARPRASAPGGSRAAAPGRRRARRGRAPRPGRAWPASCSRKKKTPTARRVFGPEVAGAVEAAAAWPPRGRTPAGSRRVRPAPSPASPHTPPRCSIARRASDGLPQHLGGRFPVAGGDAADAAGVVADLVGVQEVAAADPFQASRVHRRLARVGRCLEVERSNAGHNGTARNHLFWGLTSGAARGSRRSRRSRRILVPALATRDIAG